ncbi:hypothetical protein LOTGIDRAFT_164544 [Lottia gigantea]|uniref:Uncharacterized protein n=1 Tax=Lottia gigantea TaxID=225164 RepID=V3ZZQ5_LOTGI|nr:hypothetical protein LOTGIDRAFT_164544 [Lottia gigantea]ESO89857.1 hypothetical protein LOTGIDRAFT_164544 [Lottia gigantea]
MADSIEEKPHLFQMPFDTMGSSNQDRQLNPEAESYTPLVANEDCTNPPFDRRLDEVPPEAADGVADQDGRSGGNLSQEEDERPNGDSSQDDERPNGDSSQEEDERPIYGDSSQEDERPINGDSSQEDERSNGDSFQEELHSGRKRLRKAPSRLTYDSAGNPSYTRL